MRMFEKEQLERHAARFGMRGIPPLIAFKNGREVARQSGAVDLLGWINAHV